MGAGVLDMGTIGWERRSWSGTEDGGLVGSVSGSAGSCGDGYGWPKCQLTGGVRVEEETVVEIEEVGVVEEWDGGCERKDATL